MKYRSRIDIIAKILQAAMEGSLKTHIMFKANLSYAQLHKCLEFVIQKELIIHEDGNYRLSPKGLHFLNVYDEIADVVSLKGIPWKKKEALIEVKAANRA